MALYCDLDGVLVNFDAGYEKLTGIDLHGNHIPSSKEFWKPVDEAGVDFWENLTWLHDGKVLWNYIKNYKPTILSSPSRRQSSRIGKQKWINRELPGTHLELCYAKQKHKFSKDKTTILIDDREDTIMRWREKGGIGILHFNAIDTINQLKYLGL